MANPEPAKQRDWFAQEHRLAHACYRAPHKLARISHADAGSDYPSQTEAFSDSHKSARNPLTHCDEPVELMYNSRVMEPDKVQRS